MVRQIKYCPYCRIYTLKDNCPLCGRKTIVRKPPKFGPEDPYGEYRRKMKKELGIYLSRELEEYMFKQGKESNDEK